MKTFNSLLDLIKLYSSNKDVAASCIHHHISPIFPLMAATLPFFALLL